MFTKEALEQAQAIGMQRVLARYGLNKTANIFSNVAKGAMGGLKTFGSQLGKGNISQAFTKGWQNLGTAGQGALIGAGGMYAANKMGLIGNQPNQRHY